MSRVEVSSTAQAQRQEVQRQATAESPAQANGAPPNAPVGACGPAQDADGLDRIAIPNLMAEALQNAKTIGAEEQRIMANSPFVALAQGQSQNAKTAVRLSDTVVGMEDDVAVNERVLQRLTRLDASAAKQGQNGHVKDLRNTIEKIRPGFMMLLSDSVQHQETQAKAPRMLVERTAQALVNQSSLEAKQAGIQAALVQQSAKIPIHMNIHAFVQAVLRESYLLQNEQLKDFGQRVKFYNELRKSLRERADIARRAEAHLKEHGELPHTLYFVDLETGELLDWFWWVVHDEKVTKDAATSSGQQQGNSETGYRDVTHAVGAGVPQVRGSLASSGQSVAGTAGSPNLAQALAAGELQAMAPLFSPPVPPEQLDSIINLAQSIHTAIGDASNDGMCVEDAWNLFVVDFLESAPNADLCGLLQAAAPHLPDDLFSTLLSFFETIERQLDYRYGGNQPNNINGTLEQATGLRTALEAGAPAAMRNNWSSAHVWIPLEVRTGTFADLGTAYAWYKKDTSDQNSREHLAQKVQDLPPEQVIDLFKLMEEDGFSEQELLDLFQACNPHVLLNNTTLQDWQGLADLGEGFAALYQNMVDTVVASSSASLPAVHADEQGRAIAMHRDEVYYTAPSGGPAGNAALTEHLRQQYGPLITAVNASSGRNLGPHPLDGMEPEALEKHLANLLQKLEDDLKTVGEDAQMASLDLQQALQEQQQTMQMMSNISKVLHETAMAIIRKIGG